MSDVSRFSVGKGQELPHDALQKIEQAHAHATQMLRTAGNKPWIVAVLDVDADDPVFFASGGAAGDMIGPAFLLHVAATLEELAKEVSEQ